MLRTKMPRPAGLGGSVGWSGIVDASTYHLVPWSRAGVVIVYLLIIGSCGTEIVIPGGAGGGSDGCVAGFRNVAPAADVAP